MIRTYFTFVIICLVYFDFLDSPSHDCGCGCSHQNGGSCLQLNSNMERESVLRVQMLLQRS